VTGRQGGAGQRPPHHYRNVAADIGVGRSARHPGCRYDSVCAAGCGSSERPRQVETYATQRLHAPSRTTVPETEAGAHPRKPGPLFRPSTRTPSTTAENAS